MAPSCRFIWSPLVILASCHRPSHSFPSVISFEPEATRRKDDDEEMNGEGTRWAEGHGSLHQVLQLQPCNTLNLLSLSVTRLLSHHLLLHPYPSERRSRVRNERAEPRWTGVTGDNGKDGGETRQVKDGTNDERSETRVTDERRVSPVPSAPFTVPTALRLS